MQHSWHNPGNALHSTLAFVLARKPSQHALARIAVTQLPELDLALRTWLLLFVAAA